MEAVAAHMVLLIILHGQGIEIGALGHGLVEGGVEHGHLRHIGQDGVDGVDASHVHGIVQRGNAVALLDHGLHLIGDEHALVEFLATMHHAVAHSVDFVEALDAAHLGVGEAVENALDGTGVVGDVEVDGLLGAVVKFQLDESVGQTNLLYATLGQHSV